jgi:hypothetical protein
MPSGETLDLSGTWLGTDYGRYELRQDGTCLSWSGQSLAEQPSPDRGAIIDAFPKLPWSFVFVGHIDPNFDIDGQWADVVPSDRALNPTGELSVTVDFFTQDGTTKPKLFVDPGATFNHWSMAPQGTVSARTELVGTYDGTQCLWLNVDGQRYEMWGEWFTFADQMQLLGDDNGIMVRPGDRVRVDGQLSPGFSSPACGTGPAILVWDLVPEP